MPNDINLSDTQEEFEEKVVAVADEVLDILKELSQENKKQISSQLIAEKLYGKDSFKNLFNTSPVKESIDPERLQELSNIILDKFTELLPSHMSGNLSSIRDSLHNNIHDGGAGDWLDSPIEIIKKYIDSLSIRNSELEGFIKQTMSYLSNTELNMTSEFSSQQKKFDDDRVIDNDISSNINSIGQNISSTEDLSHIKSVVMGKIENINQVIDTKRENEMIRLKETEKTLAEMSSRMSEIKQEADAIRKKSDAIEYDAIRDALTGLYNRKAYDQRMSETIADVNRYDVTISLMICDIDFFKKINDTHGHKVGDLALKKLASLLKERLRINDIITRYGGEEFAILLPHTNLDGAQKAGEGIRSYIDKASFSYKGQKIPLTISVGISQFRKGDDKNSVFERTDKALYLAKQSGRNVVKTELDIETSGEVLSRNTV
jgi:diguanylate cyclase